MKHFFSPTSLLQKGFIEKRKKTLFKKETFCVDVLYGIV